MYGKRKSSRPPNKNDLLKMFSDGVVSRSDLYCYFYVRALQLLTDGGVHVFVCSNSWLDVGYGAKLQEHLLKNGHVFAIYESAVERQFSTALINTIISMIEKTSPRNADISRFVQLQERFESAIAPGGKRREIVKSRVNLLVSGKSGSKFTGDKWGGKYLRAPDIYHHVLDKCADQMVRLSDIATVKRGITTGANKFFFLDRDDIDKWGIEDRFLRPVMTSPQESRSILVDSAALPNQLFMCHEDKDVLANSRALEYINWGETQGYHRLSTCAARKTWYGLSEGRLTRIASSKMIDTTWYTFLSITATNYNNVLYEIHCNEVVPTSVGVSMNSTVC